jgi:hypothetical protein
MKKILWLVVIVLVAFTIKPAAADFYVVGGGGRVGTQISSVPYTISVPGFYYLAKNLTYSPTTGSAIFVDANDVTLDLMGFCLEGPGQKSGLPSGIWVLAGRNSVEIRNGFIQGFGNVGIYADANTSGVRVIGLKVRDTGTTGIDLLGNNNLVTGCSIMNAKNHGINVGDGSQVNGNNVSGSSERGINGGRGVLVMGNMLSSTTKGVYALDESSIIGNTITRPAGSTFMDGIIVGKLCIVTRNNVGMMTITAQDFCVITNNASQNFNNGLDCPNENNAVYYDY